MVKGQIVEKNIAGQKLNSFFEPIEIKLPFRKEPNSDDKQLNVKKNP